MSNVSQADQHLLSLVTAEIQEEIIGDALGNLGSTETVQPFSELNTPAHSTTQSARGSEEGMDGGENKDGGDDAGGASAAKAASNANSGDNANSGNNAGNNSAPQIAVIAPSEGAHNTAPSSHNTAAPPASSHNDATFSSADITADVIADAIADATAEVTDDDVTDGVTADVAVDVAVDATVNAVVDAGVSQQVGGNRKDAFFQKSQSMALDDLAEGVVGELVESASEEVSGSEA
jgi:hypothetical protein